MDKLYIIKLDGEVLGKTLFEKADAPMGVVMGAIIERSELMSYQYLKSYCKKNKVDLIYDTPENQLIILQSLDGLQIFSEDGAEIKGLGNELSTYNNEAFDISVIGIAYPFYEEEFPHHVKAYEEQFN